MECKGQNYDDMELLSIKKAAKQLGVNRTTLTRYINEANIPHETFGKTWAVLWKDVKDFKPDPRGSYKRQGKKSK